MSRVDSLGPLAGTFAMVEGWLRGTSTSDPAPSSADEIAEFFGLDSFGRNILLLCSFTTLEPQGRRLLGELLDDPRVSAPTVGLALARLPGANWHALTPESPLRRHGLVHVEGTGALVDARLRLPEAVLFSLLGTPALEASQAGLLRALAPGEELSSSRARFSDEIAARFSIPGAPVLHLIGGDPEGKLAAFAAAAGAVGCRAYMLSAELLPPGAGELAAFAAALARDMWLTGARLVLTVEDTREPRVAQLFAEVFDAPLAISSPDALRVGQRLALRLEMPRPTASEQAQIWRAGLGDLNGALGNVVPRLAGTFRVSPEVVETIATELSLLEPVPAAGSNANGRQDHEPLAPHAWRACRAAARPRMDDLAQRVETPAQWDDLILPMRQMQVLESIVAQVRNRARVYEEWGFGPRLQMKGLGVSALFSGPSGSGKSMAGEVIGNALDLDVYRVDLASIVSKWVGETEKNLRRVFDAAEDGGVILQFDEADALFGKRSEVKDSHDRHANIEVSYLLQRLEAYRGLCILTTNMRDNIDEAFLRRLRFLLGFRFPGRRERRAIWERIFPTGVPLGVLDYDRLAQLNVPGGSIRNIALGASFLAADRDAAVSMDDIQQAALLEYDKVGRTMTDAERAGWAA